MKTFVIQGHFSRYRSMADKSLQLTFETREPDPETVSKIQEYLLYPGFIAFKPDQYLKQELDEIDKLRLETDDNRKSQSWRMRSVLYRMWEQSSLGFDSFEMFYNHKMEMLINNLKAKLLP